MKSMTESEMNVDVDQEDGNPPYRLSTIIVLTSILATILVIPLGVNMLSVIVRGIFFLTIPGFSWYTIITSQRRWRPIEVLGISIILSLVIVILDGVLLNSLLSVTTNNLLFSIAIISLIPVGLRSRISLQPTVDENVSQVERSGVSSRNWPLAEEEWLFLKVFALIVIAGILLFPLFPRLAPDYSTLALTEYSVGDIDLTGDTDTRTDTMGILVGNDEGEAVSYQLVLRTEGNWTADDSTRELLNEDEGVNDLTSSQELISVFRLDDGEQTDLRFLLRLPVSGQGTHIVELSIGGDDEVYRHLRVPTGRDFPY